MKKVEIPEDLEKIVSQVCDAALRGAGLQAHELVAQLKAAWAQIKPIEDKAE